VIFAHGPHPELLNQLDPVTLIHFHGGQIA
jgi:hypothetical protein